MMMNVGQSITSWFERLAGSGARDVVLGPDGCEPLSQGAVRLAAEELPLQIRLGEVELVLWQEAPLSGDGRQGMSSVLLADTRRLEDGIHPFVRIAAGERFALDPESEVQRILFAHPDLALRHRLRVDNDGDTLTLRDRILDRESVVLRLPAERATVLMDAPRRARDAVLGELAGAVDLLPPEDALDVIREVNEQISTDPSIGPGKDDIPGAILRLPERLTPILLGDLHGRVENLLSALCQNAFFETLMRGDAALVLLGDVVHPDGDTGLDDMSGSMLTMDVVLQLKRRFPGQVHIVLGNHDSFSPELNKGGVLQGPAWEQALLETRGVAYRDAMRELYSRLPLIVTSAEFSACHAGPPRASLDANTLAAIRSRPDLIHELTWNRPAGRGRPEGYTARDVSRFRSALGLPGKPIVTAHHPRSADETVWTDVAKVRGHHVVYSSRPDNVGVITRIAGELIPLVYPVEPLASFTR